VNTEQNTEHSAVDGPDVSTYLQAGQGAGIGPETALARANAAIAAKRAAGESIKHLRPDERAQLHPESRAHAISAKCYDCVGGLNADGGYRAAIRECPASRCALHRWRPYRPHHERSTDELAKAEAGVEG
jgi:hypothetical protein